MLLGGVFKWDLQWMRDTLTVAVITCSLCKLPLDNLFLGTFAKKDITKKLKSQIQ